MQLIGMLDSPYVRRTAISLRLLGIPFTHRAVSVFSTFQEFQAINPVVKAPSLICDDGTVLMDSNLILDYAAALADSGRLLIPTQIAERQQTLRITGLALAACEKSVQMVYEQELRPPEKQHAWWLDRVRGQLLAAYGALEIEVRSKPLAVTSETISQAGVTAAVAWQFTQMMLPETVIAASYPALQAHGTKAEQLPEFLATPPDGPGVAPK
jgi:glutathione S-transferase